MLAGLDARQLQEMYAFAQIEPLDLPLQRMIAELTATIAKIHGNDLKAEDFMLAAAPAAAPADDRHLRSQQMIQHFMRASAANDAAAKRKRGPPRAARGK